MAGAPFFLKGITQTATPEQLQTLRLLVLGAERVPESLWNTLRQFEDIEVLEGYGITECSPIVTITPPGKPRCGVGQPLPGVSLCVVHHETHEILPQGTQGVILIKGPNVFGGYLQSRFTGKLASPFIKIQGERWYVSGDLGYLDAEGNLFLSGRLKRFVKIGGEMISLGAVEHTFLEAAQEKKWPLPEEGQALAVSAVEPAENKTKLFLFTSFPLSLDDANQTLREAGYSNLVRISGVIQVHEIPLLGTGKVNYRELEAQMPGGN